MALRLTLLTHAPTQAQREARFPLDEPVTVAKPARLRFPKRARFLCAPERRAQQTAAWFCDAAESIPVLRDCDFGRWAGRSMETIALAEPGALKEWMADWQAAPHGGESLEAVYQRTWGWMNGIQSDSGQVVAVTHPAVARAALMGVLQCPPQALTAIDVAPLAALTFTFNGVWRYRAGQDSGW